MSFGTKMMERRRSGPQCECFDCIRREGLTPPLSMRNSHKMLYPSPAHPVLGPGVDGPSDPLRGRGGYIDHDRIIRELEELNKKQKEAA